MVPQESSRFRHEVLLHSGDDEFVDGVSAFVRSGLACGEPAIVLAHADKLALLRKALADCDGAVSFVDIAALGPNPARIIPYWRDVLDAHEGLTLRGVEAPVLLNWSGPERSEMRVHEALLNIAFADASFSLLCPYDTKALEVDDIEHAIDNHPLVGEHGRSRVNGAYADVADVLAGELPEPDPEVAPIRFDINTLHALRRTVDTDVRAFGLDERRRDGFVLAMSEIATNSLLYGGGEAMFRCWTEDDRYVCEVANPGRMDQPLAGRVRPSAGALGGRGLYLVNQLADLVQVRTSDSGTVVRIHVRR